MFAAIRFRTVVTYLKKIREDWNIQICNSSCGFICEWSLVSRPERTAYMKRVLKQGIEQIIWSWD